MLTILMPSGNNAKPAILKLAMPNGIPMFVMHNSTPAKTRAMAIQIPAKMNHSTLPIIEPAPVSGSGTTVRPFGHNAKLANLNDEIPNGIVTIKKNRKDSSSASRNDPLSSTTQVTLPHIRGARCMAYRARRARRKSAVSARPYQQGSPAGLGFRRADVEGLCLHVDTSQR